MWEFLLELIWVVFDVPRYTGKILVFVLTLGQVRVEDDAATAIGWIFWIVVAIVLIVLAIRHG